MVVVDASVLVDALLLDGGARARVVAASLQAPELIDAELLSVLRRLVLARRLSEQHALQALATSQRLGLRRHVSRHLWLFACELRCNHSAYDMMDVALAERLGATLLTADARAARPPAYVCCGRDGLMSVDLAKGRGLALCSSQPCTNASAA